MDIVRRKLLLVTIGNERVKTSTHAEVILRRKKILLKPIHMQFNISSMGI